MKLPIIFTRGDEHGTRITLTSIGDIMMQGKTQLSAQSAMDHSISDSMKRVVNGFKSIFEPIANDLNLGDILVGNLETPIAVNLIPKHKITSDNRYICENKPVQEKFLSDGHVYGETKYPKRRLRIGLPNFNAHPSLAIALKEIGFDLVTTANNHTLDRGHNGIDRSIEALRLAKLDFIGTTHSKDVQMRNGEEFPDRNPFLIKGSEGINIAFFSFTNFINQEFLGFRDDSNQIFLLPRRKQFRKKEWFLKAIRSAKTNPEVDLVVLSVHWGIDYVGWIFPSQRRLAYEILEAGADIILGHHSHVLQPMEKYATSDGRETFIIYSLGNFTSDMPGVRSQTSIILYLGITKNDRSTFVSGVQYIPVARRSVEVPNKDHSQIQVVAIDRFPENEYIRHRKLVERLYGKGNIKPTDCDIHYPG